MHGQPLIGYTILAALNASQHLKNLEVIVSTDDEEIKSISENFGANVPFLRPAELSGDTSTSLEYVRHALNYYEERGQIFDSAIILQPTSPLRETQHILEAIEVFEDSKSDSLISVYQEDYINEKVSYSRSGSFGVPKSNAHNAGNRRQEDESYLVRNGAVYIVDVDYFKKAGKLVSDRPAVYEMPKSRSVNIDTIDDFIIADSLLGLFASN